MSPPDLNRLLTEAWAERDELRDEVERLRDELRTAKSVLADLLAERRGSGVTEEQDEATALERMAAKHAERDRLRAVFDALGLVIDEIDDAGAVDRNWELVGEAYHRARAGVP